MSIYACGVFITLVIIFYGGTWIFAHLNRTDSGSERGRHHEETRPQKWTKEDITPLTRLMDVNTPSEDGRYTLYRGKNVFHVETSIDTGLQNYITNLLNRSLTHNAAVVVMKPDNGQILALVNHGNGPANQSENLCLKAAFPAASLFKIVSAAAAIEARGFRPEKSLAYRGRNYTLYRSQLTRKKGRYTTKVSFKKACSKSINPVFGKMGIYDLGRVLMEEYAGKFLFNRNIPFDMPLEMSRIQIADDDFALAEIASGFNKRTLISPLHAALITSAIANGGKMMTPWFVKRVRDDTGHILYHVHPAEIVQPIKAETASTLRILMNETVRNGTVRKSFRSLLRRKQFKDVEFGAKTGTINDRLDKFKFDWVTAYALPKTGRGGICLTTLAIHGEKLGIRARDIARLIIKNHFTS
ncbi:MAG: hypothetical protein JRJ85_10355 [Deltaproteobacteria bacterium]|nr:hypothetical protein [Deltaproteobacteria bacterium]